VSDVLSGINIIIGWSLSGGKSGLFLREIFNGAIVAYALLDRWLLQNYPSLINCKSFRLKYVNKSN